MAIFVKVEDPVALSHSSFFSDHQYLHATQLILVPLELFNHITESIGTLQTKLALIGFTARSGSTLVSKAVAHAKEALVVSEPMSLKQVGVEYGMDSSQGQLLSRNTLVMYSHYAKLSGASTLVIKPTVMSLEVFSELFPQADIRHVLIYRNPIEVVCSLRQRLPKMERVLFQSVLKPVIKQKLISLLPKDMARYYKQHFSLYPSDMNCLGAFIWWLYPFEQMVKLIKKDPASCLVFTYESFIASPMASMEKIFSLLEFDHSRLEAAVSEFAKDSQKGTVLSQDRKYQLTPKEKERIRHDVSHFLSHFPHSNLDYSLEKAVAA